VKWNAKIGQQNQWEHASPVELLQLCENIGVGRRFCQKDRPPSYEDTGLRERIAKQPLPKGGLLLIGPVGSHKTHMAAARTVDAARRGFSAYLLSWPDFCLRIRETYAGSSGRSERQVVERYAQLDYLCVDDFGIGREDSSESEATIRLAYQLINHRYQREVITDLTCNWTLAELGIRFDQRIARRLEEMTTPYVMLLPEVSEDAGH